MLFTMIQPRRPHLPAAARICGEPRIGRLPPRLFDGRCRRSHTACAVVERSCILKPLNAVNVYYQPHDVVFA
jgi:hypothetical protein